MVNFLPNRLSGSEPVFLFTQWSWLAVVLATLVLILGVLGFIDLPRTALVLMTFAIIGLCILAGLQADLLMVEQSSAARVSLASGFWLLFAIFALMILDSLQHLQRYVWTAAILIILIAAILAILTGGYWDNIAIVSEYHKQAKRFNQELYHHLQLVGTTLIIVLYLGIPLGFLASKKAIFAQFLFSILNTLQTLPSIALFALLIAPLSALSHCFLALQALGISGIGYAPALIALVLYTLLPITRNTYAAFCGVPEAVKKSAQAMGMTRWQLLYNISLPLALPVILSGIRIVLVQAVGLTVVAALIGAGGLGIFVWQGLGENVLDLVLLGAIPTIAMALILDLLMQGLIALSKT